MEIDDYTHPKLFHMIRNPEYWEVFCEMTQGPECYTCPVQSACEYAHKGEHSEYPMDILVVIKMRQLEDERI